MNQYQKTNKVEDKYFSKINTQDKAYILGMLLADGHLQIKRNAISLSLSGEEDGKLVQKIANRLFVSDYQVHNDHESSKNPKHQDRFQLWLTSKQMTQDLMNLGFTDNKTKICEFNFDSIPPRLMRHFIRGFFDGDGSVYLTKYKSLTVHFVGLENIIKFIQKYLQSIGIKSSIYPCFSSNLVCELRFGNVHHVQTLYDTMYRNANLLLPRKKRKFEMGFDVLNTELTRKFTSNFIGVFFDKSRKKWKASTWNKNKIVNIGRFDSEKNAAIAYNKFIIENGLKKELNKI